MRQIISATKAYGNEAGAVGYRVDMYETGLDAHGEQLIVVHINGTPIRAHKDAEPTVFVGSDAAWAAVKRGTLS